MNTSGPFRPLSWAEAIVRATTFFSKVWRSSSWSSATAARPCWHSGPGSYYQVAIGGHTETAGGNSGPLCETCHPVGGPGVPNHFPIGTTSASSRAGCPGHWSERNSGHGPPSSGAAAMPCAGTGEWPIDSSEPAPRLQVRSVMDAPYAGSTGSPDSTAHSGQGQGVGPPETAAVSTASGVNGSGPVAAAMERRQWRCPLCYPLGPLVAAAPSKTLPVHLSVRLRFS